MTPERLIIETLFRIPNKNGIDVDFKLNDVQVSLDENRTLRNIIPKARQRGISTYIVALFLARCLSVRNRRCVVVSHTAPATQKLFEKTHYILKNLKGGVEPQLRRNSIHELYFEKTDSTFYIGTAGSEGVGVGDTITDLHCSEPALWDDPMPLLKGLFNAVPMDTGTIFIEGTGNGMGNWYHRQCMRASEGGGAYKLHFFSWTDAAEYRLKIGSDEGRVLAENLDDDDQKPFGNEKALFENGVLGIDQIAWRRAKIEEMDFDLHKFKEQYPLNLNECFQGAGASFFHQVKFELSAAWHKSPRFPNLMVLGDHPKPLQNYLAGADIGAGCNADNTVLQIFSIEEMRQVGEWVSNSMEPHIAAIKHAEILKYFNNAYVNAERNNHGILYIKELLDKYDHRVIHLSKPPKGAILTYGKIADYGTFTSGRLKPEIVGALRRLVARDVTIHSPALKSEMDSFVENPTTLQLEAQDGCLDDRVLAAGMAMYVLPRAAARVGIARELEAQGDPSPFQLEGILKGLETTYNQSLLEEDWA